AYHAATWFENAIASEARLAERAAQCDLLREIFGNPFRPAAIDPLWQTLNDAATVRLARSSYDAGDWEQMPILADALEDAGCADAAILGHARHAVGHVRGCWVIDLLLSRE